MYALTDVTNAFRGNLSLHGDQAKQVRRPHLCWPTIRYMNCIYFEAVSWLQYIQQLLASVTCTMYVG